MTRHFNVVRRAIGGVTFVCVVATGVAIANGHTIISGSAAPKYYSATSWSVNAGAESAQHKFEALDFFAHSITIDAGDSVTWTLSNVSEPHTISFLAPGQTPPPCPMATCAPAGGSTYDGSTFTSSGALFAPATYTLTFTKPGRYKYYCLIHQPEMIGEVVVQRAGTRYPHDQTYYNGVAVADAIVDLNRARQSVGQNPFPEGGTTLAAGIAPGLATGPPTQSSVLRFVNVDSERELSNTLTISVGTTLTWVNESNNSIHTVTFPPVGQPPPRNPFIPPAGGPSYDGSALANSGVMFPTSQYSLTFTKSGNFKYYCLFHDGVGMVGTVTVK